jgi:hypothetical protein
MVKEATRAEVKDLEGLDAKIENAATSGDFATLETLLAPDFIYTHTNGRVQNRAEWFELLGGLSGKRERNVSEVEVEVHDDIAVTRANLDVVGLPGGTKYMRTVKVYRLKDGRWQAISNNTLPANDRKPA